MKRINLVLLAAILAVTAIACQKTPEIPVVVPKDQEAMLGKADQQSTAAPSKIPEHYTFRLEEENFTVNVDADVVAPYTD